MKELSFPVSDFLELSEQEIKIEDKLEFFELSKSYVENFIMKNGDIKNSGIYFISGVWGSGKSSFVNHILWHIQKYLQKCNKEIILIQISPWILKNSNTLLNDFLEILSSELLKREYDASLKASIRDLKNILNSSGSWYLKILASLVWIYNGSIEDKIKSIRKSIDNTYKNYEIVFIIDDMDRVGKNELIMVGKVLDIIQKLIYAGCNNDIGHILCFYTADSNYLQSFYHGDFDNKYLNFYQYFHKFGSEQPYNVYIHSKGKLEKIFLNEFNIEQNYELSVMFDRLQTSLEESGSPLTIRSIKYLIKQFNGLYSTLHNIHNGIASDEPLIFMDKPLVENILTKLFNPILKLQILGFLCYLEKDPGLFDIFNKYTNELKYLNLNDDDNLKNFSNDIEILEKKGIFLKRLGYFDNKGLLSFINSNDYILIRDFCMLDNLDYTLKKFINERYMYEFTNKILNAKYNINKNDLNYLNNEWLGYSNFGLFNSEIKNNIGLGKNTEHFDNFCNNFERYFNFKGISFKHMHNFSECILSTFKFCMNNFNDNGEDYYIKKFSHLLKTVDNLYIKKLGFYFYSYLYFSTSNLYNYGYIKKLGEYFDDNNREFIESNKIESINSGKGSMYFGLKAINFLKGYRVKNINNNDEAKRLINFIDTFIGNINNEYWLELLCKIPENILFLSICSFIYYEKDEFKYYYESLPNTYWKKIYKNRIKKKFSKLFDSNYKEIVLHNKMKFSDIPNFNKDAFSKIIDECFGNT